MSMAAHRPEHRPEHRYDAPRREAGAPLFRRALAAIVLWLAVFGLFALAEGWSSTATVALVVGVVSLLGLALHHVVAAAAHSVSGPDAQHPGVRVNPRRNGYRTRT